MSLTYKTILLTSFFCKFLFSCNKKLIVVKFLSLRLIFDKISEIFLTKSFETSDVQTHKPPSLYFETIDDVLYFFLYSTPNLSSKSFSTNLFNFLLAAFGRMNDVLKTSFVDKTTLTSPTTSNSFFLTNSS